LITYRHYSLYACPHGIYESSEANRFVAISCTTDTEWLALAELLDLDISPLPISLDERMNSRDPIEESLAIWCKQKSLDEIEGRLIELSVPVH